MLVGIIRNRLKSDPNRPVDKRQKIYLLAMLSHYHGATPFVFFDDGVDPKRKIIKGWFFNHETSEFEERETRYPDVVDTDCTVRWKDPNVFRSLYAESAFIYTRRLSKKYVDKILLNSKLLRRFTIKTYPYMHELLDRLLVNRGAMILKPAEGSEGRGVHKVKLNVPDTDFGKKHIAEMKNFFGKKYIIEVDRKVEKVSYGVFKRKYNPEFRKNDMVVQEYVESTTKDGNPFDIRIESRRGTDGKWVYIRSYVKVGRREGIVSNVSQGGLVTLNTEYFLGMEFGGRRGRAIYKKILRIANNLPKIMQRSTIQFLPTITVDVGIARNQKNRPKIFEVNTGAATTNVFSVMKESKARIRCHKFMFENKELIMQRQKIMMQEINDDDSMMFRIEGFEYNELGVNIDEANEDVEEETDEVIAQKIATAKQIPWFNVDKRQEKEIEEENIIGDSDEDGNFDDDTVEDGDDRDEKDNNEEDEIDRLERKGEGVTESEIVDIEFDETPN